MDPRSDRGAVLIQTAIAVMLLTIFCAFVLDQGVTINSRREAQNAADAAALAAGTALVYDNYMDRTSAGPAHTSGVATGVANNVFGQPPGVVVDQSLDPTAWFPTAPSVCTPASAHGSCVQASVFRDGTNGSATLPTYFAGLVGVTEQKARATATVQLLSANASKCLKPWFAMDKSDTTTYGFTDFGTLLVLRANTGPSSYRQADFNRSGGNCPHGGGACYRDAIVGCVGKDPDGTFGTGDEILEKTGNMTGPNNEGMDLYNQDPDAVWNPITKAVDNSCAVTHSCACANAQGDGCANGLNGTISPRIIAVGLFRPTDVAAIAAAGHGGIDRAPMKNIAGVFMLQPGTGPDPTCTAAPINFCGYLTAIPGEITGTAPAPGGTLNVVISLIR